MPTKDLQQGWATDVFTNCIDNATSNKLKIPQKDFKISGKYPIIDQSVDFIAGYTDNSEKIYKGDLPVIIFGDHTRIFKYVDFPFALGADGVQVLVPDKSRLIGKYLYFFLKSLRIVSHGYSRHYKFLKEKEIVIPPKATQTRIVEMLEKAEQLQQWRKESDKLTNDYLNSLFQKMFGDPETNPMEWIETSFGKLIIDMRYGTSVKCSSVKKGTPVLRIPNIIKGTIDFTDLKYANSVVNELEKYKVTEGNLLFVRTNGNRDNVGRSAVFHGSSNMFAFASYLIKAELSKDLDPTFANTYFSLPYARKQLFKSARTSAGQYNVNTHGLKSVKFILPPIDLQLKFRSLVENIQFIIEAQHSSQKEINNLSDQLFKKAFESEI